MGLRSFLPAAATRRVLAATASLAALLGGSVLPAAAAPAHWGLFSLASAQQLAQAYTSDQLATAYNFTSLYDRGVDGSDQKIALIETGGVNAGDLTTFNQANSLPAAHITQHYVGGKTFTIQFDPEATLDVEWAHAMAPGATILLYYINDQLSMKAGWAAMGTAIRQAATKGVASVGISLGACKPGVGYQSLSSAFAAAETNGVSVFVASGDDGDHPGPVKQCGRNVGVAYPASDPSVIAVGGTSLQLNPDNTIAAESAWNLSGGGVDSTMLRPVWQKAATMPSASGRWAPDVSFVGDPETGVRVMYHGRWREVGGTSLGAPVWAAIWSLIREDAKQAGKTVGAAESLIYQIGNSPAYASAFHDIVDGSNGQYSAGPGWDPVTGWGTPDVANLDAAVVSLAG
jgi:kumamolisin